MAAMLSILRGYSRVLEQFATISTRSGSSLFINGVDPFRNDSIRGRGDDLDGRKFVWGPLSKLSLFAINHDEI